MGTGRNRSGSVRLQFFSSSQSKPWPRDQAASPIKPSIAAQELALDRFPGEDLVLKGLTTDRIKRHGGQIARRQVIELFRSMAILGLIQRAGGEHDVYAFHGDTL